MDLVQALEQNGHAQFSPQLSTQLLSSLREAAFAAGEAGTRCLLDLPDVSAASLALKEALTQRGILPARAIAIQAIAFDKTPDANWKVTWHQDVMFPFARAVTNPDYSLPSIKEGVDYARPPQHVLTEMLAVRLHLDECDETNGPLRVASGSHKSGVIKSSEIATALTRYPEVVCLAKLGDAILMRPLLLHASSRAIVAKRRRVLHVVYHSRSQITEQWHRSI